MNRQKAEQLQGKVQELLDQVETAEQPDLLYSPLRQAYNDWCVILEDAGIDLDTTTDPDLQQQREISEQTKGAILALQGVSLARIPRKERNNEAPNKRVRVPMEQRFETSGDFVNAANNALYLLTQARRNLGKDAVLDRMADFIGIFTSLSREDVEALPFDTAREQEKALQDYDRFAPLATDLEYAGADEWLLAATNLYEERSHGRAIRQHHSAT